MGMTRNEFLRSVIGMGIGAAAAATLVGCGGDDGGGGGGDDAPADASGGGCTTPEAAISANHGHTLNVPIADVNAAVAKTYDIMGASPHSHSITISAVQFGQLANGQTLNLTSTAGGGHTHGVTVQCLG